MSVTTSSRSATGASSIRAGAEALLKALGVDLATHVGKGVVARSPIDGVAVAELKEHSVAEVGAAIARGRQASAAFLAAGSGAQARRIVRLLGGSCPRRRGAAGHGWSRWRPARSGPGSPLGEVQEMIDICDFAVGLSRQLYGLTIATERPGHAMRETWHPLGVGRRHLPLSISRSRCGRGMRRWRWSAATPSVWKPSEKTPLTALAVQSLFDRACKRFSRGAGLPLAGDDRRSRGRRSAGRRRSRRPGLGHRLDADGAQRRRPGWPSASAARCSNSAATTA